MEDYKKRTSESTIEKDFLRGRGKDVLEQLALEGFKEKLLDMLKLEIEEYLGRRRYERTNPEDKSKESIYRNGYSKQRSLSVGSGTIKLKAPRLREPYESKILDRYQTKSEQLTEMILDLYLHGISTGDFSRFLDKMLGEEASLSSSTIQRLKQNWEEEFKEWKTSRLKEEYLYVWADGIYPKAGPKDENMALLVVIGVNRRGEKEILALEEGYRESYESWKDVFLQLKERGVDQLGLTIADGIKGLWKAVMEIYPKSKQQRCWVHKMMNILDKVPTQVQQEVKEDLREIYYSNSIDKSKVLIKSFKEKYSARYPKAVNSLEEAEDRLLSYFSFPKSHWKSIKSTNPIESCFATVKLRTNAARRIKTRASAVYLIFKVLTESQKHWRKINGHRLVKSELLKINNKNYVAAA